MSTLGSDASLLSLWGEFLGDIRYADVETDQIIEFMRCSPARQSGRGKAGRPLAKSTRHQRRSRLLTFYRWLVPDGAVELFRDTEVPRPKARDLRKNKLVPRDDLARVIKAARRERDKMAVMMLFETGFRAGELCALNMGSVRFRDDYAELVLPDVSGLKTGPRTVIVIDLFDELVDWFQRHPNRDAKDAPLFYSLGRRNRYGRLSPPDLYAIIRRTGERANLAYRLHPHMLRHTQATEKAMLGWNEAKMRIWFGWAEDSEEPSTYIHLNADQVHRAWLAERGRGDQQDEPRGALEGPACSGCGANTILGRDHCRVCRLPVEASGQQDASAKNPELMELLAAEVARQLDAALGHKPTGRP